MARWSVPTANNQGLAWATHLSSCTSVKLTEGLIIVPVGVVQGLTVAMSTSFFVGN